jgi:hypothetical protein
MIVVARNSLRYVLICWILFALAACGGGGGDSTSGAPGGSTLFPGSSGGGSPTARLKLSTSAVNVSSPVTNGRRPTSSITVSVENSAGVNYFIRVQYSDKGIANLGSTRDNGVLEVLVNFRTPYDLVPATYDDTLIFHLCTDAACNTPVTGASVTVPVQYSVLAPATPPAVSLSSTSLNLQALITDAVAPGVPDLDVTFTGLQVHPFVTVAWNGSAVGNSYYRPTSGSELTSGVLDAGVQSPSEIGPGVYDGTITLTACLDQNCVNPLAGSPITLSVHMTVADQVDGPNGYRLRIVDVFASDMVWDATRQRLYVATPDTSPVGTNERISVIDPATASVVSSIGIGWKPQTMAISDDHQYLYVASAPSPLAVQRLKVADLSLDATIPLGVSATGTAYMAREISVAPNQPLTIAVARATNFDTPANGGLVIFDNVTLRPSVLAEQPEFSNAGPFMDRVTWGADSSTLFAGNVSSPVRQIYALTADGAGAHIDRLTGAPNLGRRVHFTSGRLYADGGELYNPATLALTGKFTAPAADAFNDVTTIDAAGNRAFVMWSRPNPQGSSGLPLRYLTSFDLASRAEIATIPMHETWIPVRIARVGADRLALLVHRRYDSRVIVIDGAFVGP